MINFNIRYKKNTTTSKKIYYTYLPVTCHNAYDNQAKVISIMLAARFCLIVAIYFRFRRARRATLDVDQIGAGIVPRTIGGYGGLDLSAEFNCLDQTM